MAEIELDDETFRTLHQQAAEDHLSKAEAVARAVAVLGSPTQSIDWRVSASGMYAALMSAEAGGKSVSDVHDDEAMPTVDLDDATHALVRFAATVSGLSEAEIVARAIQLFGEQQRRTDDAWTPVDVYATYEGRRVEAKYLPATKRLTVTSDPIAGTAFKSPSGAAAAVVTALNEGRSDPQRNGWTFWRITETNEPLDVLRKRAAMKA